MNSSADSLVGRAQKELELHHRGREHADGNQDEQCEQRLEDPATYGPVSVGHPDGPPVDLQYRDRRQSSIILLL